jgi:hypothetical protein
VVAIRVLNLLILWVQAACPVFSCRVFYWLALLCCCLALGGKKSGCLPLVAQPFPIGACNSGA